MPELGLQMQGLYPWPFMREVAKFAEKQEWTTLWLTEGQWKDPLTELAALARETERLRLGSGIATIYSRSPFVFAQQAAALDDISGGRFVLGLGTGHQDRAEDMHGTPLVRPTARMHDYLTIIRGAFTGKPFTHAGKILQVNNLHQAFPPPGGTVPIYVASLGPRMARFAGEMADGVVLHLVTTEAFERIKGNLAEGAAAAGRDPAGIRIVSSILCNASRDREAARRKIKGDVSQYVRWPFYQAELDRSGFQEEVEKLRLAWGKGDASAAAAEVTPRMMEQLPVAVSPEEVWEKAERYWKLGVDEIILNIRPFPGDPAGSFRETMEEVAAFGR